MSRSDRLRGRDAGMREAILVVTREPLSPGPMPWRVWLRLLFRPREACHSGESAMRRVLLRRLRERLETREWD